MGILFTNNASSSLASTISNSAVSMTVATGEGSLFPTISTGDYFYVTLDAGSGSREIVKVTARSGDVMTIVRAQDNTTAQSFGSGTRVELRPIAQAMKDVVTEASNVAYDYIVTYAGDTVRNTTEITATAGQTTFTITGGYTVGYVDVYLNGVLLNSTDYTATNGTTVVLVSAAALNDEFKAIAYRPLETSLAAKTLVVTRRDTTSASVTIANNTLSVTNRSGGSVLVSVT